VPEIIEDGVTGYVVCSVEEALEKLPLALALDRKRIRAEFERRFSARRMARDYIALYQSIVRDAAKPLRTLATAQTPSISPREEILGQYSPRSVHRNAHSSAKNVSEHVGPFEPVAQLSPKRS